MIQIRTLGVVPRRNRADYARVMRKLDLKEVCRIEKILTNGEEEWTPPEDGRGCMDDRIQDRDKNLEREPSERNEGREATLAYVQLVKENPKQLLNLVR